MSLFAYEKKGEDHYAIFTLNRPDRLNAMSMAMQEERKKVMDDFNADENMWAGIITGAGDRAFSSGADLIEMAERAKAGEAPSPIDPRTIDSFFPFHRADSCPKPIIAAINGIAVGGGCELALSADIRIASENAYLGLFEVKRGITPSFAICNLARLMPFGEAMYYLLTADRITSQDALRYGLVHKVVPLPELLTEAERIAKMICENAPLAVRASKAVALYYRNILLAEQNFYMNSFVKQVRNSEDAREGPIAFAEKRKPVWKNR
ncbi:enoyl-CoA hydratase-related protein [Chloroflexota bacterium]